MYCRLIAVLFLVACSSSGLSQGPDTPSPKTGANADFDGAAKLAQEAIDQLKSNGVPGFIGAIFSGRKGTLKESDRPAAEAMFSRLYADATVRHGKSRGQIELVRTDSVGRSIVRFIYLDKLERGGAIWHLAFYRGDGNDWQWVGFRMTESFDPEFRTVKSDEEFKDARSMATRRWMGSPLEVSPDCSMFCLLREKH